MLLTDAPKFLYITDRRKNGKTENWFVRQNFFWHKWSEDASNVSADPLVGPNAQATSTLLRLTTKTLLVHKLFKLRSSSSLKPNYTP